MLRLVAQGLTHPEIAARLGLSRPTLESHVAHVLSKLELPTRAADTADAARQGLV